MITNLTSTNPTGFRVVIAGGGIAGLSLARALKDAGHNPVIIERNREWPMTGTAHYLPANALRALNGLGIGEEVRAAAHPISRQRVTGSGGRTLVDLPVSNIWGRCGRVRRDPPERSARDLVRCHGRCPGAAGDHDCSSSE
jgi:2-polyprenyl-6-methoxyphenol hydroxylase-like FAD-dependent oxidoreductase